MLAFLKSHSLVNVFGVRDDQESISKTIAKLSCGLLRKIGGFIELYVFWGGFDFDHGKHGFKNIQRQKNLFF